MGRNSLTAIAIYGLCFMQAVSAGRIEAQNTNNVGASDLIINEIMQSNIDCFVDDTNEFPDSWVELYNPTDKTISLSGYKLGTSSNPAKAYKLARQYAVEPHSHHVIFCDKRNFNRHADFRLESGKGSVYLFHNDEIIDKVVDFKKQPAPNISYGRVSDGSDEWGYQLVPSPEKSNEGGISSVFLEDPVFSVPGMVLTSPITLSLSIPSESPEGTEIRYTLDGSEPTIESEIYTKPFFISKKTVVRAKLFCPGAISPRSTTHSYIFHHRAMTIPIISLVTDDYYLYSDDFGILSSTISTGNEPNYIYDWRRPVNVELFEREGSRAALNQLGETKIKGKDSRHFLIKSMKLYANKRFGTKRFDYEFFPFQKPGLSDFKTIELRNAGQDAYRAYMRDGLAQSVMGENADLDWQSWQPAVVYINGKYLGILNIRETSDEDNVYTNYDGLEDIDMINNWNEVEEGTIDSFLSFQKFYSEENHTFEEYKEIMDMDEFINYFLANMYYANYDFPGNNCVMWRPIAKDGKWRWICKDMDYALGNFGIDPLIDYLHWMHNPKEYPTLNWACKENSTLLFRRLLTLPEFQDVFTTRFSIYTGDFLNPEHTIAKMHEMGETLAPEWPLHYEKNTLHWGSQEKFMKEIEDFLVKRHDIIFTQMADWFKLGSPVSLIVESDEKLNFNIVMGGIPLKGKRFDGKFFAGKELTLTSSGFSDEFWGWEVKTTYNDGSSSKMVYQTMDLEIPIPEAKQIRIRPVAESSGDHNGIFEVEVSDSDAKTQIFDLQGRRVSGDNLSKGIYIRNGKKIVVR